ncbi:MAG: NAD-binding protein [Erysipelotrichaceae bacterium]|nr:NAD-binding protein [Erysipelotrichaceae bacterium]
MKEKKVASKNRYYPKDAWKLPENKLNIIVGCNPAGIALAEKLSSEGEKVLLTDRDFNAVNTVPAISGLDTFCGNMSVPGMALEAGINEAGRLIAVSGDDNANIMAAQVAKYVFEIPSVIVLINDSTLKPLLEKTGIEYLTLTDLIIKGFDNLVNHDEE